MARIPQDTIDQIRDTADVVDIISKYVDLKKRGQNFVGLCPFHNDTHPSLYVSPSKQIYKCFSCDAGGNAMTFLMNYEKISFIDAVKQLGERYGIEVKSLGESGSKEFFTNLYALHDFANKQYIAHLFSNQGKQTLSYLIDRGLDEKTIKKFQLGLAFDNWDDLYKAAKIKGFDKESLDKSGLFTKTDKGIFDRFRNRIMFPVFHQSGKVIAFGGRAIDPKEPAKYINSPDTPLYHKSDILYGFHATSEAIRKTDDMVLVEGYMDFLQLYQAGIENIVAVSGTALTTKHINLMRRYIKRVYLAYDGDSAGNRATLRAGYLLLQSGLEPLVVPVPEGIDPDDWIQSKGVDEFKKAVKSALSLIEFQLNVTNVNELSGIEQSQFTREVLQNISEIDDGIIRSKLIRTLSEKLQVREEELYKNLEEQSFRRSTTQTAFAPDASESENQFTSLVQKAQLGLIRIFINGDRPEQQSIRDLVAIDNFTDPFLKRLTEILFPIYDEIDYAAVIDKFEKKSEQELVAKILMEESSEVDREKEMADYIKVLRLAPLKKRINDLRLTIRELERKGEDPADTVLELSALQKELAGI
ncbi:DNA primase [Candidatus Neomarinimicrobiota bacterium]